MQDKMQRIGQGRTAEIFLTGDKVVKLFRQNISTATVEKEFNVYQLIHQTNLPIARALEIIEEDGRLGIIFEYVSGPSMKNNMISRPWSIKKQAQSMAQLHIQIHKHSLPQLPSLKQILEQNICQVQRLTDSQKERILTMLDSFTEEDRLCHGDFHPDNIIISPQGPVIIDWLTSCTGNPCADVARTSILLKIGTLPPGQSYLTGKLINSLRSYIHQEYLKQYIKLTNTSVEEIARWELPLAAARLNEGLPEEEYLLLLALINKSL